MNRWQFNWNKSVLIDNSLLSLYTLRNYTLLHNPVVIMQVHNIISICKTAKDARIPWCKSYSELISSPPSLSPYTRQTISLTHSRHSIPQCLRDVV